MQYQQKKSELIVPRFIVVTSVQNNRLTKIRVA